jgi:hypothetical protein
MSQNLTPEIIIAAIAGFESQKHFIDSQIADLRSMLDGRRTKSAVTPSETGKPKRRVSLASRRKMAAAQRARYAKLKQGSEPPQAATTKPMKRKLSAAGRKAIIAATKKRWAAVKAAKQAEKPAVAKRGVRKKATAKEAA